MTRAGDAALSYTPPLSYKLPLTIGFVRTGDADLGVDAQLEGPVGWHGPAPLPHGPRHLKQKRQKTVMETAGNRQLHSSAASSTVLINGHEMRWHFEARPQGLAEMRWHLLQLLGGLQWSVTGRQNPLLKSAVTVLDGCV